MLCKYLFLYVLLPATSVLLAVAISVMMSDGTSSLQADGKMTTQVKALKDEVARLSRQVEKLSNQGSAALILARCNMYGRM